MASDNFSSPVQERYSPQWHLAYQSALQEANHKTLFRRIEVAEAAILTRRDVLAQNGDGIAERQQIAAALARLCHLKKEVLKFS